MAAASSSSGVAAGLTEDDDEVVAELDVYVSQALADHLYLVQYPQWKPDAHYDEECIAARVNPEERKIELEFAPNNDDPSYDAEPARQFIGDATTSDTDVAAEVVQEHQAHATVERPLVTVPDASTYFGETVKNKSLEGVANVEVEPPTDATSAGPVMGINVEPGTSDGVRRSMKVEPGSSINPEPTTSGASRENSVKVNTSPANTGATKHSDGGAKTSMDSHIVMSTVSNTRPENYAVGLLLPGELHLTPLHAIVSMAPALHHLHHPADQSSDADAKAMPPLPAVDESSGIAPESDCANNDLTTQAEVYVNENDGAERSKHVRQRRFAQLQRESESEPWVDATVHYCYSETSLTERELLVGPRSERHVSSRPGERYLRRLLTGKPMAQHPNEARSQIHALPGEFSSQELSMHDISCLPLEDQITAILRNVKVIDFGKLMSVLPCTASEESVLNILQYAAVLVQGCWVVKSEELYPWEGISEKKLKPLQIREKTLCNARDLLLYMYTETRHVVESAFADTLRQGLCSLPHEDIRALLEDIARPTPDGWEFLLPCDSDFTKAHPDVVLKQHRVWRDRRVALSRTFRPSVMARLQKKQRDHGESSSNDGSGNKACRRRTTSKTLESTPRSSCGSPVTKLSKMAE